MINLQDKFIEYLYEFHSPIWDDRLVDLMEDGDIETQFLEYMGLPTDMEINDKKPNVDLAIKLCMDILDPEKYGFAVSEEVGNKAREVFGININDPK